MFLFKEEARLVQDGNGRLLILEDLVAFLDGKSEPICKFSAAELDLATNNYDQRRHVRDDAYYSLYKGHIKGRPVYVKRYRTSLFCKEFGDSRQAKDITIGSAMSSHNNVLKLVGCCLDDTHSILVYERVGTTTLSDRLRCRNGQPLPWLTRLKIALDLASAISCLHTAFSLPVVHRNIKSSDIILDEAASVPKLMDFALCISIPEGKSHAEDCVIGTKGYGAPEYIQTGFVSEKVDVYDFGVLLCELLTGKTAYCFHQGERCFMGDLVKKFAEEGRPAYSLVDERVVSEGIMWEQLLNFSQLLLRCLSNEENDRPTMIQVAEELQQIYQSTCS